jgi:flavin-dependent dehydrogenase
VRKISVNSPKGGYILTGGPIQKTFYDNLLIVGDAAGQVKPTTGGGVVLGGLCALTAGKTVSEALEEDDCTSTFLSRYQRRWISEIGNEIRTMLLARKLLNMVNDEEMDKIFKNIRAENLVPVIQELVEGGDMDFQAEFIKKSLKNPRLTKIGLKILGMLALDPLVKIVNL